LEEDGDPCRVKISRDPLTVQVARHLYVIAYEEVLVNRLAFDEQW
jgi:hypothetical protein